MTPQLGPLLKVRFQVSLSISLILNLKLINTNSITIGTVYFNACHGCQKCTVIGKRSEISRTVTFPKIDALPRTNESFRRQEDPDHHKITTPLTLLDIDMVLDFPAGDALHLLHLGIMKRLLISWREGDFGSPIKWTESQADIISEHLVKCQTPKEIHRKLRSLKELPRWKGTEFRTFLLYASIVILKKHLLALLLRNYHFEFGVFR